MSGQRDERLVIVATAAATATVIGAGVLVWYRTRPADFGRAHAAAAAPGGGRLAAGGNEPPRDGSQVSAAQVQSQSAARQPAARQPPAQQQRPAAQPAADQTGQTAAQLRLSGAAAAMLSMVEEDDEEEEEQQQPPMQHLAAASVPEAVPATPARPLPREVLELAAAGPPVHSNSAPAASTTPPAPAPAPRTLPPGSANPAALAQASNALSAMYSSIGTGAGRRKMPPAARAERLAASNQSLSTSTAPARQLLPSGRGGGGASVRVGSTTSDGSLDSRGGGDAGADGQGGSGPPLWQRQQQQQSPELTAGAKAIAAAAAAASLHPMGGESGGVTAWPVGGLPTVRTPSAKLAGSTNLYQDSSTASSSITSASADVRSSSSSSAPGSSSAGALKPDGMSASTTLPLGSFSTLLESAASADATLRSASGGAGGNNPLPPELDWELDGANLELCRREDGTPWQLGQGSFGTVYKALSDGVQPVAVKIFPTHATPQQHAEFQREVVLLKSCRDGNIVQFLGASQTEHQTLMITEYMENGDLFTAIRNDNTGSLLWYRRDGSAREGGAYPGLGRQIALDIARGLHFLHRHSVVHFDLKSPNVLLGRQHVAKIADVGLAKILQKDYVSSLQSFGTFAWSAPEVLLGARCSEKLDIYGLGVILWELVTGESPARGRLRAVRVPDECPIAIADLITRCMDSKPANRPSAKDVVVVLSEQAKVMDRARGKRTASGAAEAAANKKAPEGECSEELISAIVNMCHIVGGPASGITREEAVAAATFKDELHTYKMYVREVQKTLATPSVETEGSPAHQRLVELVESHRAVMVIFMQEHTNTIRRFQFVSLQEAAAYVAKAEKPDQRGQPAPEGVTAQPSLDWPLILDSLELTKQQRKSLAAARGVVAQRLRAITEERKRLMAALHSFVLQTPQSGGFVSAVDHSEGLKANLEEEGALLQDFHIVFTCKTLTALQQARLELGAFPCLPDAMTVCGLIAADMAGKRIAEQVDKTYDAKNAAPKQRPGGGEKAEKTEKTVRARSL